MSKVTLADIGYSLFNAAVAMFSLTILALAVGFITDENEIAAISGLGALSIALGSFIHFTLKRAVENGEG